MFIQLSYTKSSTVIRFLAYLCYEKCDLMIFFLSVYVANTKLVDANFWVAPQIYQSHFMQTMRCL